ncbi:hypothetical protein ACJMK2_040931 [Sinanodonta woodiana]|uniref:Fibronectin type-III domain-containing protein n=1 Tax=Sinanodonta woodiana TaxID=1069815 RepID=A0ABD3W3G4_SINWO
MNVRPNAVDNLIVTQLENSRRVLISWSRPHDLVDTVELIYRVTLRNQWGEQESQLTTNNAFELTDSIPYTRYVFEINCKPVNAVGEVYWSTPANRILTTRPALPNKGPIVNDGAFALRNCGTEDKCLVLYWKHPPAREINGKLVGYTIIIASGRKSEKIKNRILYIMNPKTQNRVCRRRKELPCIERSGEYTSAEVSFQLPNHTDIVAGIALRNTVGLSIPSFIVISAFKQEAPKPDLVIVEEGESNFQVSWMLDNKNLSVTTVTYFWCTKNRLRANTTLLCDGTLGTHSVQNSTSLDWKSFILNRNNIIISASNQSSLYFAVALVQNETSGGMVWQGCKFLKGKAPNKPVYQVYSPETNGTLLQIEIPRDSLCQADNAGRPETYTVSYKQVVDDYTEGACPQDGFSNETFEVQLEREIQHYTLSGLMEDSKYFLCLGSANRDLQTIQYGPGRVFKTTTLGVSKSKSSSVTSTIIITIARVGGAVVFFIALYVCLKYLRRCMKRPAIIVPDVHGFKKEEVHAGLDDIYIEVDGLGKIGPKASEINDKNGGLDADSGTGGSVESSCSGYDIKETKYMAPERRDSGTSSRRSASYNRLVQTTSTAVQNPNDGSYVQTTREGKEETSWKENRHSDHHLESLDRLVDLAIENDGSYVQATLEEKETDKKEEVNMEEFEDDGQVDPAIEYLLDSGSLSVDGYVKTIETNLAKKETLKPCTDNPVTTLPLKLPTALQVKLNTGQKEHGEPQSVAETLTIKVVPNPNDSSYVQATLEENETDKKEEVNTEEFEGKEETSWEENRRSDHHLESLDGLVDLAIENLFDSGSLPVDGYVKTIETNLGSGAFSISDSSSGLSETLMPIYIKPAEVSLSNQYLCGMDLSNDEVDKIEEIPWDLKYGEPKNSSKCQRQSFQNNVASYIQEIPGISIFKSHSRDVTCSECLLRDEGPACVNSKCQSNDRTSAVSAYTCGCNFNSKEESNSCLYECNLENEISLRGGTPENMF